MRSFGVSLLVLVAIGGAACAATACIFDQGSYEGGGRRGRTNAQDSGSGAAESSTSSSSGAVIPPADSGARPGDT